MTREVIENCMRYFYNDEYCLLPEYGVVFLIDHSTKTFFIVLRVMNVWNQEISERVRKILDSHEYSLLTEKDTWISEIEFKKYREVIKEKTKNWAVLNEGKEIMDLVGSKILSLAS